jgi:hypothetical protein
MAPGLFGVGAPIGHPAVSKSQSPFAKEIANLSHAPALTTASVHVGYLAIL